MSVGEALSQYLGFILHPLQAEFAPVDAAAAAITPLGIAWRLVYRVRLVAPECNLLTLTTSDPNPVIAISRKTWHPGEARILASRRQIGADTWEYDTASLKEQVPLGEVALDLTWSTRTRSIPLAPIVPTAEHHVGWGKVRDSVEVPAAVSAAALAWAVTELLTGIQAPPRDIHNAHDRFEAVYALKKTLAPEVDS